MHSQANVRAGKVLRPPIRALPSVIVDTEKVLQSGWVRVAGRKRSRTDGKVFARGAPRKPDR